MLVRQLDVGRCSTTVTSSVWYDWRDETRRDETRRDETRCNTMCYCSICTAQKSHPEQGSPRLASCKGRADFEPVPTCSCKGRTNTVRASGHWLPDGVRTDACSARVRRIPVTLPHLICSRSNMAILSKLTMTVDYGKSRHFAVLKNMFSLEGLGTHQARYLYIYIYIWLDRY